MGTRMRSQLVKVLHPLGGRPMLTYPVEALRRAGVSRVIVVVGHQADKVRAQIGDAVEYAFQKEQLGTAHAVMQTRELLEDFQGTVVITYGDTPLYRAETYQRFITAHAESGAAATILATVVSDPHGYGRIVRTPSGDFHSVVEQKDITSPEVEAIREINTGTYCFEAQDLFAALEQVHNANEQGEYYLPDALACLRASGRPVRIDVLADPVEALGINDRRQLAEAEAVLRARTLARLMEQGVTIVDPQSTYVHPDVEVGPDTVIYPFTSLEGATRVGPHCTIGPNVRLVDVRVGAGASIQASVAVQSVIDDGAVVGPFAHLTPGSHARAEASRRPRMP